MCLARTKQSRITSFNLLATLFLNTAKDSDGLPCYKGTLLARGQLGAHQKPQRHSSQSCFYTWWPPVCTDVWGYFFPAVGLAFLCVELADVPVGPFLYQSSGTSTFTRTFQRLPRVASQCHQPALLSASCQDPVVWECPVFLELCQGEAFLAPDFPWTKIPEGRSFQ